MLAQVRYLFVSDAKFRTKSSGCSNGTDALWARNFSVARGSQSRSVRQAGDFWRSHSNCSPQAVLEKSKNKYENSQIDTLFN